MNNLILDRFLLYNFILLWSSRNDRLIQFLINYSMNNGRVCRLNL